MIHTHRNINIQRSFVLTLHEIVHCADPSTSQQCGEDGELLQMTDGNPHLFFLPCNCAQIGKSQVSSLAKIYTQNTLTKKKNKKHNISAKSSDSMV